EPIGSAGASWNCSFTHDKDDDAPNANTTWQDRSVDPRSRSDDGNRGSSGAGALPTNPCGLRGRGFCSGRRARRYRAAGPLHHADHAGEAAATEGAPATAEGRSATGGGLPGEEREIRTTARVGGVAATGTGTYASECNSPACT